MRWKRLDHLTKAQLLNLVLSVVDVSRQIVSDKHIDGRAAPMICDCEPKRSARVACSRFAGPRLRWSLLFQFLDSPRL